ncbi:unnamed protein product [Orchesella dallaii]|uniref:Uncharacterized protein n=1 Tax=Orchesella dallaii TaxID=48710 RepID=A0ABP1S8V2_9HEXA
MSPERNKGQDAIGDEPGEGHYDALGNEPGEGPHDAVGDEPNVLEAQIDTSIFENIRTGETVFALWGDRHYYSGKTVIKQGNLGWLVAFDDGAEGFASETKIYPISIIGVTMTVEVWGGDQGWKEGTVTGQKISREKLKHCPETYTYLVQFQDGSPEIWSHRVDLRFTESVIKQFANRCIREEPKNLVDLSASNIVPDTLRPTYGFKGGPQEPVRKGNE